MLRLLNKKSHLFHVSSTLPYIVSLIVLFQTLQSFPGFLSVCFSPNHLYISPENDSLNSNNCSMFADIKITHYSSFLNVSHSSSPQGISFYLRELLIFMTQEKISFSSPLGDFFLYTLWSYKNNVLIKVILVPLRGFLFIYFDTCATEDEAMSKSFSSPLGDFFLYTTF